MVGSTSPGKSNVKANSTGFGDDIVVTTGPDNTIAKRKRTNNDVHNFFHVSIDRTTEPNLKPGMNSCALEW
jgi:hypothetical protein